MVDPACITAEQYVRMPVVRHPSELVRGRIVPLESEAPLDVRDCILQVLSEYLEDRCLGHVVSDHPGVITQRNPDTVREPAIAFYSFANVPPGMLTEKCLEIPPDLIFEIRSAHERWSDLLAKVSEYLSAGVSIVSVVDPEEEAVQMHYADKPLRVLRRGDMLALPEVLGDFRICVQQLVA